MCMLTTLGVLLAGMPPSNGLDSQPCGSHLIALLPILTSGAFTDSVSSSPATWLLDVSQANEIFILSGRCDVQFASE